MTPSDGGDDVIVTTPRGERITVQLISCPLPRGEGIATLYRCPACRKPRRYLYRWARSGQAVVDYLGLRCQACAGLPAVLEEIRALPDIVLAKLIRL